MECGGAPPLSKPLRAQSGRVASPLCETRQDVRCRRSNPKRCSSTALQNCTPEPLENQAGFAGAALDVTDLFGAEDFGDTGGVARRDDNSHPNPHVEDLEHFVARDASVL